MADPHISNVSLLLLANGTEGATTFVDSGPLGLPITTANGAHVSTTSPPIGTGSLALSKTTEDYLTTPASTAFDFGIGSATIEFYIRTSAATAASDVVIDYSDGLATRGWTVETDAAGKLWFACFNEFNTASVSTSTTIIDNGWHHVAFVVDMVATHLRAYFDGVLQGDDVSLSGIDVMDTTHPLTIGAYSGGVNGGWLDGGLDSVRITKGVVRYSADFTPPTAFDFDDTSIGPGAITASLSAPAGTLTATGYVPWIVRVSVSPPLPVLTAASGAFARLTAPSPTLRAIAHDSTGEQAAYLTAPHPSLTITTGANAKALRAPSPTLTASGTVTIMATATLRAPKPTLSATGTVSGMATATLSAPRPNLIGYGGAVCSVKVRGRASLTATGTTGGVASVAVTCPLFELTATASTGNVATANLVAPSPELGRTIQAWLAAPSARLTAIGSAVVTATYEAYAVNLGHRPRVTNQELPVDEVTHYTNFPFTHVVRYKNSYYGANSTGLYLLEGTTDAGTAIPWAVKTAMDDFKTPVKKTVAAAYFGGRFGPASTVQLHAGEQTPNTYSFTTPRDALVQNHRQVFGKGVKERYFALGASGIGVCEIDSVELETHNMTRRI